MNAVSERSPWPRSITAAAGGLVCILLLSAAAPAWRSGDTELANQLVYPGTDETVVIERDGFGIPHVFADTTAGVSFGAGYAMAEDRYFLAHLLKLLAHGRLGDFAPVPEVIEADQWTRAIAYTPQERAAWLEAMPSDVAEAIVAYVEGINLWIDEANRDPERMPLEMVEYGLAPIPEWTVDDTLAFESAVSHALSPAAGGNEIQYAALLERLRGRHGGDVGLSIWNDLIRSEDRDATSTILRGTPWRHTPTHARDDEAALWRQLEVDHRLSLRSEDDAGGLLPADRTSGAETADAPSDQAARVGTLEQLSLSADWQRALEVTRWFREGAHKYQGLILGSNAQLVAPGLSESGNALMTAGPQAGFGVPAIYLEMGLHGGSLDVTGMGVPGLGPFLLIGRGNGYAWTGTNGYGNLFDTFVIQLDPDDPRRYLHDGSYERMACRMVRHDIRGVPAPAYDQEVCRTRFGLLIGADEEANIGYVWASAAYNRDWQLPVSFFRFNEASSLEDFATAAALSPTNFNFFYADDRGHIGFWHTGNFPRRAAGTDPRLPQDASAYWTGLLPLEQVPHLVDPPPGRQGFIVNWNNAPAVDFPNERFLEPGHRGLAVLDAFTEGGVVHPDTGRSIPDGLWDATELDANLQHGAYRDHNGRRFFSSLPPRDLLEEPVSRAAFDAIESWDFLGIDRQGDGLQDSPAPVIFRYFHEEARQRVFRPHISEEMGFVRPGEVWHVLSTEATVDPEYDWLDGTTREAVAAEVFEAAIARIRDEFDSDDPMDWRQPMPMARYNRLNADFWPHLLLTLGCDLFDALHECPENTPFDPEFDSGRPGEVPGHVFQNRGTYNHVVAYLDRPRRAAREPLGTSRFVACSIHTPGQSGFINLAGEESPHYQDLRPLYVDWQYHRMPVTHEEVDATLAAGKTTCSLADVMEAPNATADPREASGPNTVMLPATGAAAPPLLPVILLGLGGLFGPARCRRRQEASHQSIGRTRRDGAAP